MLGQAVGNLVPGRFGIHEDVHGWTDARIVQQRTHCDVHVFTVPDDRIDQGSAISAMHVVCGLLVAVDQQPVAAAAQADIRATDTRQGFEGGARRSTALRTVAVQRIFELAPHRILNGTAKTLTAQLLWHDVTLRVRLISAMGVECGHQQQLMSVRGPTASIRSDLVWLKDVYETCSAVGVDLLSVDWGLGLQFSNE